MRRAHLSPRCQTGGNEVPPRLCVDLPARRWTLPRAAGVLQGGNGVAQRGSDQHHVDSTPIRQLCELEAGLARHGEHCSEHCGVRCEAIPRGILRRGNLSRRDKPCKDLVVRWQLLMVVTIASNAASRASGEAGDSRMRFRRGRPQCATASARTQASVLLQFVPKRACGCSSCDAGCRGISRSQASALLAYEMAAYGIR